jgi:small subunit ribosomal protein S1
LFEDKQRKTDDTKKRTAETETKRATRKLKSNLEKTTLGDISDLAALKTEMEQNEKKTKEDSTKDK